MEKLVISNILKELGIPANLLGYHYTMDAIQMVVDNGGCLPPVTKIVYPDIAVKRKSTSARVERAIRHAVEKAFLDGDGELIDKIFKSTVHISSGKVTNAEFIAVVADYIITQEHRGKEDVL